MTSQTLTDTPSPQSFSSRSNAARGAKQAGLDPSTLTFAKDADGRWSYAAPAALNEPDQVPVPAEPLDEVEVPAFLRRARQKVMGSVAGAPTAAAELPELAQAVEAQARLRKPKADVTLSASNTPRAGTKQAAVIALLQRPEGATLAEIMAATGWLAHTVRGAISGALRKKLGMTVTSAKEEGRGRLYRVG